MEKKSYPKPALTADIVVLSLHAPQPAPQSAPHLRLLLIQRGHDPFQDQWALPGGFCEPNESVEQAAARELEEETGLNNIHVQQLHTFSTPGRDPRGWVVSVLHLALIPWDLTVAPTAGDDAQAARWWSIVLDDTETGYRLELDGQHAKPLAFDHDDMVALALRHLRHHASIYGFSLLPSTFTASQFFIAQKAIGLPAEESKALWLRLLEQGVIQVAEGGDASDERYIHKP